MTSKHHSTATQSLVALYDDHCRIVWISEPPPPYKLDTVRGKEPWVHITDEREAERLQAAMLRVLTSMQLQIVDVAFPHVGTWRLWIHFVDLTEVRMAEYARKIPPQISLLTDIEKRICKRLSQGEHTPDIADAMNVSRSTISAHRANIARKLYIATDALVSWCGGHAEWF